MCAFGVQMVSVNANDKKRKRDDVESFIGKHSFLPLVFNIGSKA